MRSISLCFSIILCLSVLNSAASARVTIDPAGFAVVVEPEDTLVTELNLHNDGDEDVAFDIRIRNVNRGEEERRGPRRDDPGDLLGEIELEHPGAFGFCRDYDNDLVWVFHMIIENNLPVDAFFTAYQFIGNDVEVVTEIEPDGAPIGGAYYDGVLYGATWGANMNLIQWDLEGNNLGEVDIGNPDASYLMSYAVDPERGYLFVITFPEINVHVLDINDDLNQVGLIQNILNGANAVDFRGRICWVPEHEDGNLWVSWRPEVWDPDNPVSFAWQVDIDEEWNWEEIQNFEVETDTRSFGIGHNGWDILAGRLGDAGISIIDDGIVEPHWLLLDPLSGDIAGGEETVIGVIITPGEMEAGVYENLLQIELDDPDQPEIQIAAVMSIDSPTATITGLVTDAANDQPVADAQIDLDYYMISRITNDDGEYSMENLPMGEYELTFFKPDYLPNINQVNIDEAGEIELNVALLHSECNPDPAEFVRELEPDGNIDLELVISNDGNGPLTFIVERHLLGDVDVDPWEPRGSFSIGQEVEDDDIFGVVFIDDQFYVSGENDGDPSIYVFDRDGGLVETIEQVGEDDRGIRGMTWDGELIWGTEQDRIYGFTPDGELVETIDGPFRPISAIAWDPDRGLLWVATTTRDIVGMDLEGNEIAELPRNDLRIYGLAYWQEDPDGHPLYVLNKERDTNRQTLHKYNPDEADTMMFAHYLDPEAGGNPLGAHITNQYDYYSWVFMNISSASRNAGGDRIDIWQLDVRRDWFILVPTEGVIEAGEDLACNLHLDATGLPTEIFEGEIVFYHDGVGGETHIPVTLNVVEGRVQTSRTLELSMGWNMVSVNLQPNERDVTVLTQPLVEEELLLLMKDSDGNFYNPEFGFNNIPGWFVEQGYLIKVSDDCELRLEGESVLSDDPIDLEEGWQIVSYYPRTEIEAMLALSGIREQLLIAKDVDGNFYIPAFNFSNMGDLCEGQGYQLKMDEAARLVYTLQEDLMTTGNGQQTQHRSQPKYLPIHPSTGANMSLLVLSGTPPFNSSPAERTGMMGGVDVGVYASGMLVGSGRLDGNACGVAIWGDDPTTPEIDGAKPGDQLEIIFCDNEGQRNLDYTTLEGDDRYTTDGLWIIDVKSATNLPNEFGIVSVYPNPFNNLTRLTYELPEAGSSIITVYDAAGRNVLSVLPGQQSGGVHSIAIDGSDLPNGLYIIQLQVADRISRRKITLIK